MTVDIRTGFRPEVDGEIIGATGLRYDAFLRDVKETRGLGGAAGRVIVFADQFDALQDAIDSVQVNGGTVLLPPAYSVNITAGLTLYNNVAIYCPTRDAVITDTSGAGILTMINLGTLSDITLCGISFVGKSIADTVAIGHTTGALYRLRVIDCYFTNLLAAFSFGTVGPTSFDCSIDGCRFYHNGYDIAYFIGGYRWRVRNCLFDSTYYRAVACGYLDVDVVFENCVALLPGSSGSIQTGFSVYARSVRPPTLIACDVYMAGCYGFHINGEGNDYGAPKLTNCIASHCKRHGFYFHGTAAYKAKAICMGCQAIDNSYLTANGYSGFYMGAYSERVSLIGCEAFKLERAEQKYGFEVAAGASKCEVRGGRWSPNQTGSWLDNGTETIIDVRDD